MLCRTFSFGLMLYLLCGFNGLEAQTTPNADTNPSISPKDCIYGKQDVIRYYQTVSTADSIGVTFYEPLCSAYVQKYETFSQLSSGGEKKQCGNTTCEGDLCYVSCYPREPCKSNIIHVTPIYKPEYNITAGTYEVTFLNFTQLTPPWNLTCTHLINTSLELTWRAPSPHNSCPVTSYSGNCTALSDPANSMSFTSSRDVLNHTFSNLITDEKYICVVVSELWGSAIGANITCRFGNSAGYVIPGHAVFLMAFISVVTTVITM